MKTILSQIMFAIMLAPMLTIAQTSTTDAPKTEDLVVVATPAMNILYIGIDNIIEIGISGEKSENIKAESAGAKVTKISGAKWSVRVNAPGSVIIQVYLKKNGKEILYASKDFRVKSVPSPIAMIAGKKDGEIEKAVLLKIPYVSAVVEDFLLISGIKFAITSFSFGYFDGKTINFSKAVGANFSAETIEIINKLNSGDNIYIEDIKAIGPDATERYLSSLTLTIK